MTAYQSSLRCPTKSPLSGRELSLRLIQRLCPDGFLREREWNFVCRRMVLRPCKPKAQGKLRPTLGRALLCAVAIFCNIFGTFWTSNSRRYLPHLMILSLTVVDRTTREKQAQAPVTPEVKYSFVALTSYCGLLATAFSCSVMPSTL